MMKMCLLSVIVQKFTWQFPACERLLCVSAECVILQLQAVHISACRDALTLVSRIE